MKKNRRGLGRGLEALIQSTAPERDLEDTAQSGPSGSAVVDADPTPDAAPFEPDTTDISSINDNGGQAASSAESPEADNDLETTVRRESVDEDHQQAGTPPSPTKGRSARTTQVSSDLTNRYLNGRQNSGGGTVPRETRRPVDVFFPDRRTGDDVDLTGAAGSQRKQRQRPTMPSLQSRTRTATSGGARSETTGGAQDQTMSVDHSAAKETREAEPQAVAATDGARRPASPRGAVVMGSAGDAELRSIPVADIHPNPRQPRDVFDEDDMDELVASIGQVGVLQPIVVREVDGPSPFELVMGERRWRATQLAGLTEIPAIVRHTADTDLLRDALLENLHRSQLNPLEEAAAYEQLLEDFNCTQDELSARIGRSRPQITNTLRLLKLPPLVQRRVASGVLSAGHARALLALVDPAEMERLAQKVVSEGLSVRATEELVSLQDGVRQVKPTSRAKRTDRHERLDYLANSLTDRLDTTVKITLGARKGKIAIDFASVDDLNRIMDLIGQDQAGQ